jgi:hypothetical protein
MELSREIFVICDVIHDNIMSEYDRINHIDDLRTELEEEANTATHEKMERIIIGIGLQTSLEIYQDSENEAFPTIRGIYHAVIEYCYDEVTCYRGWDALQQ